MDIRNIKNWKENPKYQEIKLRMQDVKVKKTFRWIFEIAVTLAFAALTAVLMFQTVTMQGKRHGTYYRGGRQLFYESGDL